MQKVTQPVKVPPSPKLIAKLDEIITQNQKHSKTANHFYKLKTRLIRGESLTSKMQENLAWIINQYYEELE